MTDFRGIHQCTIGVDIGGTFTDVSVLAPSGRLIAGKSATVPSNLSEGVIAAIQNAASSIGLTVEQLVSEAALIKHGSTVATNALITRSGARVGLVTTAGFEDTPLIMRAVGRVDGLPQEAVRHVTSVEKPAPIVPRDRIVGVHERIDSFGSVVVPMKLDNAEAALQQLVATGVESIAICFLHSWANAEHELQLEQLIRERHLGIYCSVGSRLSRTAGEYGRMNTAILNAFVGPTVETYLRDLEQRLRRLSFRGRFLVMQGNGGLAAVDQTSPISTLQSGPAGGMYAAAEMTRVKGHGKVVTADMGGTSFDVGLVQDGYWRYADEPIFERFRIHQPIIEVESIGAGGGTIARVDRSTGRLLVGPESAGASPGPVCYGKGGAEPTVTDANLVLGYLDPDYFLGGRQRLDKGRAAEAIEEHLAKPLGLDMTEAAYGVYSIINSRMSDLIRRQIVWTGHLPEEHVLYPFGGAGPVHAVGFGRDLGIQRICIFPSSAVFSAFGIGMADMIHTRIATRSYALPVPADELNSDLLMLEHELLKDMGDLPGDPSFIRFVSMNFRRQTSGEELELPWDRFTEDRVGELEDMFVRRYEALYGEGVAYRDAGVDISRVRIDAVLKVKKLELPSWEHGDGPNDRAYKGSRPAYFGSGYESTMVYDYELLTVGSYMRGPVIIEAPFTTIVVPPNFGARVGRYREVEIDL